MDKPVIYLPVNLNPQWVSGFVAGDGGFSIYVRPSPSPGGRGSTPPAGG